ncbi:MAG: tetratricopeptide repeat protein [Steroidobacteraceae bacterium]
MLESSRRAQATRRRCLGAAVLVVLSASAQAAVASTPDDRPPPTRIRDLDYGDVLFHYYQDDYLGALVRLEAARDLGRLPNQGAEAELLSGGLYLSLGLHAEATRIFDRLLGGNVPQSVSDRARFYLARIGYQRGYYDQSLRDLGLIKGTLPGKLESERRLLVANVLMALGRYGEAASELQKAGPEDDWAPYARYNLGVALVRTGNFAQGTQWLAAVGTMTATNEEQRSLRDRANLSLGYALLQQRAAEPAASALSRVRLQGPYSNKALLGLGWAEADAKQPDRALVPWLELRNGRLLDAAVQESYLAVPYAYAQLASNGQAAQQYRYAVQAYVDESRRLDESIAAIRRDGFLDSVLAATPPDDPMGWAWQLRKVPDAPQTRYLYHLLASHAFQEGLRNYRDLRIMQRNLASWGQSLEALDEMVVTRQLAAEQREPRRRALLDSTDFDGLAARQSALEAQAREVDANRDVAALASPEQAAAWAALESDLARIEALPDGDQRDELLERARLLRGVLMWQLDADFKQRMRALRNDLRDTGALLADARRGLEQVDAASASAPQSIAGYANQVQAMAARVQQMGPRIDDAAAAQQRVLVAIAVDELESQKRRLASYATQAQFALAAIYDGATAGVNR